jgi:hypothetical protein
MDIAYSPIEEPTYSHKQRIINPIRKVRTISGKRVIKSDFKIKKIQRKKK